MTAAIADEQDLKRGELVIECLTFLIQRLYVMDEGHVSCFYMLYRVYVVFVQTFGQWEWVEAAQAGWPISPPSWAL